jgi:hypothetical protein
VASPRPSLASSFDGVARAVHEIKGSAISTHFHSSAALTSIISVATQLGYCSGLLVFVPLGDSAERRTLIVG